MQFYLTCGVVLFLVACGAAAFAWALVKLLGWGEAHGVPPGHVMVGAAILFAVFSLWQYKRSGRS